MDSTEKERGLYPVLPSVIAMTQSLPPPQSTGSQAPVPSSGPHSSLEPQPNLQVQMNRTPTAEWEAVSPRVGGLALSQLGVSFDFLQV